MKVFIGLPSLELSSAIKRFHDTDIFQKIMRASRVEPHLTIKAPQLIKESSEWITLVKHSIQDFSPIQMHTKSTEFITPFSLAVMVESEAAQRLHNNLAAALGKYNLSGIEHYEFEKWTPHITIGRTATKLDLANMELIKAESDLAIPSRTFMANNIRLYARTNGLNYSTLLDIPLSGN